MKLAELADTSAWFASRRAPPVRVDFDQKVEGHDIATCDMVRLELLFTARNAGELVARRVELERLLDCPIGPNEFRRALDVYEELAKQGGMHHRRVKHPDLLIAAAAESAGLAVLHYDEDFEAIAAITGQPMRWIAPRGSIR
jgi:predicted nucleic acid-binding protein